MKDDNIMAMDMDFSHGQRDHHARELERAEEARAATACKPTHIAENERTPPGLLATPENMKACEDAGVVGVVAYSPTTGEEYSATSGDYWQWPKDRVMVGVDDAPMYLAIVTRNVKIVDVIAEEAERLALEGHGD